MRGKSIFRNAFIPFVLLVCCLCPAFSEQIVSNGRLLIRINGSGVQTSTDMGRTWSGGGNVSHTMGLLKDLLMFKGKLYAVAQNGIYSSTDSGRTWMNVCSNSKSRGDFVDILSPDNITLLALTTTGRMYKSTDDGRTWVSC